MNTFIFADPHWYHKNIIKYCNRPENYQELIHDHWNEVVGDNGIVYILGDLILYNPDALHHILEELKGIKILIMGNHDRKRVSWYESNGISKAYRKPILLDEYAVLLSHWPEYKYNRQDLCNYPNLVNIHAHQHNSRPKGQNITKQHILYSPEYENYYPIRIEEMLERKR